MSNRKSAGKVRQTAISMRRIAARCAYAMTPLRPRLAPMHYPGNMPDMAIAHSKLTAQGQISVPATIRRKLGVGPGSVLEWESDGERIVVRRAGRFTSEDVHRALFARTPRARTLGQLKEGLRRRVKVRNARR